MSRIRAALLSPLTPVYWMGVAAQNKLYDSGVAKARELGWPVVSVGSVSAGGAGKTPVVIALAKLMRARGWHVDVLTRGYGRRGKEVEQVHTEGENPAWWYGDEPVLIARSTGAPVWVGADRFEAGQAAEQAAGAQLRGLHLLDDGFQHRRLARKIDIALVTEDDLRDRLLPAGRLREPLRALGRADVVIVREEERAGIESRVRERMRPDAVLCSVRRELRLVVGAELQERLMAFCAIARPEGFWRALEGAGCVPIARYSFRDHHVYGDKDVRSLALRAASAGAKGFVTTEKDAVKLSPRMIAALNLVGPVHVAALDARFTDEEAVARDVEARLG